MNKKIKFLSMLMIGGFIIQEAQGITRYYKVTIKASKQQKALYNKKNNPKGLDLNYFKRSSYTLLGSDKVNLVNGSDYSLTIRALNPVGLEVKLKDGRNRTLGSAIKYPAQHSCKKAKCIYKDSGGCVHDIQKYSVVIDTSKPSGKWVSMSVKGTGGKCACPFPCITDGVACCRRP